ncbi:glycosyltransferase family 2 protein [Methylobacterium haplocladii]|uniref:Glycosyltransferase 2-like domain-containing protein n=1 Tax=Methylobacterium haplocladii TaxID=1176176 RepID=A0A512IVN2_9HYPH|nr:glycosyltransferase family 2 protein [Methylobacterium haplocladii]GEP01788.1 hypothetical protein MHA02_41750 [Methylobacterium haplocladii]GJD86280.1 hypothetical protein HPGCJGGD_4185 [Methylobacterium haplocladii]GLS60459.1 hypothetical protein GCM10007887_31380 [Methylobacterium haplocladii]
MSAPAPAEYCARLDRVGPRALAGYCYDRNRLSTRFVVELRIDGIPIAWTRADGFVESLAQAALEDGCYGFAFHLSAEMLSGGGQAQIMVANIEVSPARPLSLAVAPADETGRDEGAGHVRWIGQRHIAGWLARPSGMTPEVRVSLDGRLLARAPADRWHHLDDVGGARAVPGFTLHLPLELADGHEKRLVVTDGDGQPLRGSPLRLVAFPDALTDLVSARYGPEPGLAQWRATMFEALLPRSWPLTDPQGWLDRHALAAPAQPPPPLALAIIGTEPEAVERTLQSLDRQDGLNWIAAALPSADRLGFASEDLSVFLDREARQCHALLCVPAGTEFRPNAALRLAAALAATPTARLVYGDIALGDDARAALLGFPSFDYERWLEQGYGALAFLIPIAAARDATRLGAASLFRLANMQFDSRDAPSEAVVHLPGIAARIPSLDLDAATRQLHAATRQHLVARGIAATVQAKRGSVLPAVHVARTPPSAELSVVIPTRDRADLLRNCLDSIRPALRRRGAELVIVDNGSSDPATHALLERVTGEGGRVLVEPGPFNYARLCNRAVAAVRGDLVLFLNNDVVMGGEGWLDELLGRLAEPTTQAAGAVLRWPSGIVQHGGIVCGPNLSATHAFDDRFHGDPGYGDLLRVASEPSAVTGACLLVRRAAYLAVGGMDEAWFPVNFNDVDLCLKLLARGGRVVLTPHLDALHLGSASRGADRRPDQRHRYQRELAALRARWGEVLQTDPGYSPLLALSDDPYTALADAPRTLSARTRRVGAGRPIPAGL